MIHTHDNHMMNGRNLEIRIIFFILVLMILVSFSGCIGEEEKPQAKNLKSQEDTKQQEQFILVTSPSGGEVWEKGSTHDITWNSKNVNGRVQIRNDYQGYSGLIGYSEANTGRYTWKIGNDIQSRSDWHIVITWFNPNGADVIGMNEQHFTIKDAPIKSNWYDNIKVSLSSTSLTYRVKGIKYSHEQQLIAKNGKIVLPEDALFEGDITLPEITITNVGSETTPDFSVNIAVATEIYSQGMTPGTLGELYDTSKQISLAPGESYTISSRMANTLYDHKIGDAYLLVWIGKGNSAGGFEPLKRFDYGVYVNKQWDI